MWRCGPSSHQLSPIQPGLMPAAAVGSWLFSNGQAVVDVTPVIGRSVRGIDAERRDGVDRMKHLLDLPPAGQLQTALAAGAHVRDGGAALAWRDGSQDIDARQDGSVVVGRPADESEDAVRCKRNDAVLAVEDALLRSTAEADPILDPPFDPLELDLCEFTHAVCPRSIGDQVERQVAGGTTAPAVRYGCNGGCGPGR